MSKKGQEKIYQRGSAASEICDELRKEILTHELKPGTTLDETGLSHRFNVSRSPIREALNRLVAERLVENLPNRSTIVAKVDLENFPSFIEVFDLQQRYATRLAARNRTSADMLRLRELAKAFDAAVKAYDHLSIMQTNYEFHLAVAEAGKNPYLVRQYREMLSEARRYLHIHVKSLEARNEKAVLRGHHRDFLSAIEARDVESADAIAHEHTMRFHDRFLDALRTTPDKAFSLEVPLGNPANKKSA